MVGPNLVRLGGDDAGDSSFRRGTGVGSFGLSASYALVGWLALQADILITTKGANTGTGSFRLRYLEIPLLLRAGVSPNRWLEFYWLGGVSLGILREGASLGATDGVFTNKTDDLRPHDPGVVLGAGVAFELLPRHQLTFEVRYNHGWRSIDYDKNIDDIQNRAYSFLFGFRFGLGGGRKLRSLDGRAPIVEGKQSKQLMGRRTALKLDKGKMAGRPHPAAVGDVSFIPRRADEAAHIIDEDRRPGAAEDVATIDDKDRDGLSDSKDHCPDDPSRRTDGCSYVRLRVEWSRLGKEPHRLQIRMRDPGDEEKESVREYIHQPSPRNGKGAEAVLDDVARLLFDHPDVGLCIESHVLPGGNVDQQSKRQAEAARMHVKTVHAKLAGKGNALPPNRIDTAGRGAANPLPGTRPDDPTNRRLELTVLPKPGKCPAHP